MARSTAPSGESPSSRCVTIAASVPAAYAPVGWPWVISAHLAASEKASAASAPSRPKGADLITVPQPLECGLTGPGSTSSTPGAGVGPEASPVRHALPGARRAYSQGCCLSQPVRTGSSPARAGGEAWFWVSSQRR